ncbi:hypothetical protein Pyrde_0260 [Pyrodictium delaneyi]|uniref:Uncharacterized protein n=1 Tax=Pyrodictium delaneyi TaxID=1273541 RepID=A0A0P0N298_9CREN|nr:hypothetical protein [Pyrodictium delaneyi]ALL00310.1 hypothetical protein Pyrde_0260 [Pyrodictium delaneyi]
MTPHEAGAAVGDWFVALAGIIAVALVMGGLALAYEPTIPLLGGGSSNSSIAHTTPLNISSIAIEFVPGSKLEPSYGSSSALVIGYVDNVPQFYRVYVQVEPGNGTLVATGVGFDESFMLSTKFAAYLAAITIGHSPWAFDYYVRIEPVNGSKPLVAGPSASPEIYLAFLRALGVPVGNGYIATGMLGLDGLVGAVGGLEVKAEGAQEAGYRLLYGRGSEYELSRVCRVNIMGPFVSSDCGVAAEAVKVSNAIPVVSILEFFNQSLDYNDVGTVLWSLYWDSACPILRDYLEYLARLSTRIELEARSLLSYIDRPQLRDIVVRQLAQALGYIDAAEDARRNGYCFVAVDYYAAALSSLSQVYLVYGKNGYQITKGYAEMLRSMARRLLDTVDVTRISGSMLAAYARASSLIASGDSKISSALKIEHALDIFGARSELVEAAIREYSSAVSYYTRAIAVLVVLSEVYRDSGLADSNTTRSTMDLKIAAEKIVDTAAEYARYALLVSVTGKARSNLPNAALYEASIAARQLESNPASAIDHAVKSLAYSLTFFALHPGVEELWSERLPYILLASIRLGEPAGIVQHYYVERLLYALKNNNARINTLIYEAEHLYAWALISRLLSYMNSYPLEPR